MLYHVTVAGRTFEVSLDPEGVTVDGEAVEVDLAHLDGTPLRGLTVDGESHRVVVQHRERGVWDLHIRGRRVSTEVVDERTKTIREMAGEGAGASGPKPIVAPMPGMVVKVEVSEGDTVREGQGIVIVEAMKMENELRAEGAGVVTQIHVSTGQAVEKGQILVDLDALPGDDAAPDEAGRGDSAERASGDRAAGVQEAGEADHG